MTAPRIIATFAVVLLFAPAVLRAQDASKNEPEKRCDGNTREIVECLLARTKIWEQRMNVAYQQALADATDPKQRAKLVEAQKLWLKFRDANCEYYGHGPGTYASIQAGYCMKDLTQTRATELEQQTEKH